MHLNPTFLSNVHDIYGQIGDAWMKDIDQRIEYMATLWEFRFLKPMPHLSYNFVGLVEMKTSSKRAILKMAPETGSLISEMKWLQCIEKGVPEIYKFDESLNAYLMEYLEPGESLKTLLRAGDDDGATRIICQTIRTIGIQHKNDYAFRHLSDLAKKLPILSGNFDEKLLTQAQDLFHELTIDRKHDILLHGDLHHDNILSNGPGWKVIDPHGYVGDPCAEVGAMIRNATECLPNPRSLSIIIERRLKVLAEELPFDPKRIKAWCYCMTVLSCAWSFEDHGEVPEWVFEIVNIINKIKM